MRYFNKGLAISLVIGLSKMAFCVVDHGGANWIIEVDTNTAGIHINIDTFMIVDTATASLIAYDGTNDTTGMIEIRANAVIINGVLSANEKGESGGNGIGAGGNSGYRKGGGGAGYGGIGGDGAGYNGSGGSGGIEYLDYNNATYYGSGGGNCSNVAGGKGGGKIAIVCTTGVKTLTIDGIISANGGNGATSCNDYAAGGGSGGSIYIIADSLAGTGNIYANGGDGGNCANSDGGGGAGGRIALIFNKCSFTTDSVFVNGGSGGAGYGQDGEAGTKGWSNPPGGGWIGCGPFTVSGKIKYYAPESLPVEPVCSTCISLIKWDETSDSVFSNSLGEYAFPPVISGNYISRCKKDDETKDAISAFDASLNLRHAADILKLTGYQRIAGDVTGDSNVTAYDASYIFRYVVGLINSFPIGKEWKFIPTSFIVDTTNWAIAPDSIVYSPLDVDKPDQDYFGVLYGDVSGNWSDTKQLLPIAVSIAKRIVNLVTFEQKRVPTPGRRALARSDSMVDIILDKLLLHQEAVGANKYRLTSIIKQLIKTPDTVIISLPDTTLLSGDTGLIYIYTPDSLNGLEIYSIDVTITFDSLVLEVLSATKEGTIIPSNWAGPVYSTHPHKISISLAGTSPLSGNGNLVGINFLAKQGAGGMHSILHFAVFNFNEGVPEDSMIDGKITVGVPVEEHQVEDKIPKRYEFNIHPNPLSKVCYIHYALTTKSNVCISVWDISGRRLNNILNKEQKPGWYTILWDCKSISNGVYFVKIEAGKFKEATKLIIMSNRLQN